MTFFDTLRERLGDKRVGIAVFVTVCVISCILLIADC